MDNQLQVFGIRHHGPGSARSLQRALENYEPDSLLVEGPPDANELLPFVMHEQMKPPVALLVYVPDDPRQAVFYPFAVFSPEWIAIRHALSHGIPVAFMDLPQAHRLAAQDTEEKPEPTPSPDGKHSVRERLRSDPLGQLAEIAGFSDSERWWDYLLESRRGSHAQVFDSIAEAMAVLREEDGADVEQLEARREAHMRTVIRATLKRGCERLAVVCGAWHAPVLREPHGKGQATADGALLKGLPKTKTAAAWVPWSYDRLSFRSGYWAGVVSPAYYHLLWTHDRNPAIQWMTRVARLMRQQDLDASSANVIEAVRLADSLAALRHRPLPGLEELDEAAQTVMCIGSDAPMQLIRRKLVIGDRLGQVPDDAPVIPLQQDLGRLQKRLRLRVSADSKQYDLDLRKPLDLDRSHLFHRLNLLNIPWGEKKEQYGKKGTFHELWSVQWRPEFVVGLVDAGRWGSTVESAATAFTMFRFTDNQGLPELTGLLDDALLADLPQVVSALMSALQNSAARGGDVLQLMTALPSLAKVTRYGNVRQTDASVVMQVCDGLVARICVGLPPACSSLSDEAAKEMFDQIVGVADAVSLLQQDKHQQQWLAALALLASRDNLHGLVGGRAVRLLHDSGAWESAAVADRLSLALSTANDPAPAAAWIEGFLSGSGLLLVHDENMWAMIDKWLVSLSADHFMAVLPLLRRTFSTFPNAERRQMSLRVSRGDRSVAVGKVDASFDFDRAALVLPVLARILGVEDRT